MASCASGIKDASDATTPEGNIKAGQRLAKECQPPMEEVMALTRTLVTDVLARGAQASAALTERTDGTIRMTMLIVKFFNLLAPFK